MTETKFCKHCKRERNRGDFGFNVRMKDGYQFYCRECSNKQARERYGDRYDELAALKKNDKLILRYGITLEVFNNLLAEQDGTCAICDGVNKTRSLAVDHCHTTGTVRGLLCDSCNLGIGKFKDDPELLRKVIEYLSREI